MISLPIGRSIWLLGIAATACPLLLRPSGLEEVAARSIAVTSNGESVVVVGEAGVIERRELSALKVLAKSTEFASDQGVSLQSLGERVLAVGSKKFTLLDERTLDVLLMEELEGSKGFWAASEAGDAFVLGKRRGAGTLYRIGGEPAAPVLEAASLEGFADVVAVAFSPGGEHLALATGTEVRIVDARTLEVRMTVGDTVPGTIYSAAFYTDDFLAVGWGNESTMGPPGVDLCPLLPDAGTTRLQTDVVLPFGGSAKAVICNPDLQLVAFSVTSAGVVAAFRPIEAVWKEAWAVDYGGGNPGVLTMRMGPEGRRGYVSGMSDSHSSVIDLETGKRLRQAEVRGVYSLRPARGGQVMVGIKRGQLIVLPFEA